MLLGFLKKSFKIDIFRLFTSSSSLSSLKIIFRVITEPLKMLIFAGLDSLKLPKQIRTVELFVTVVPILHNAHVMIK